jgi:phosphopantothenoylcysteine synthetase/decarboxylase
VPSVLRPLVPYVIACGSRPAAQLPEFVTFAQADGWDVCVIATPQGTKFLDAQRLAELSGHPVRSQYKHPEEPDVLPPPDAFIIAPATFNTINKLAQGISDTLALGLLNEGIGRRAPVAAAPWPNAALLNHPMFQRSIAALSAWGVRVILDPEQPAGVGIFPWDQVRNILSQLRDELAVPQITVS